MEGVKLAVEVVGIRIVRRYFEGFGEEEKARVVLERIGEVGEPIIGHHFLIWGFFSPELESRKP